MRRAAMAHSHATQRTATCRRQFPLCQLSGLQVPSANWSGRTACGLSWRRRRTTTGIAPRIAACALQCLPLLTSAACSLEAVASETCKWMQPAPPPSAATDAAPPDSLLLGVVVVFRVSRQAFQRVTESLGDAVCPWCLASRRFSYTSYSRCNRR